MVSIRFEMHAGVADLPSTADERGAASPPRHLDPYRLLVVGADLVGLARTQQAFVVVVRRRKGWLASVPLWAGIEGRLLERVRWGHC